MLIAFALLSLLVLLVSLEVDSTPLDNGKEKSGCSEDGCHRNREGISLNANHFEDNIITVTVLEYSNDTWNKTGRDISAELIWKEGHEGEEVIDIELEGENGTINLTFDEGWYGEYTIFAGFHDNGSDEGYWNSTTIVIDSPNTEPVAQAAFALAASGNGTKYGNHGEIPAEDWIERGETRLNRTGFARVFFSANGTYDPDEGDNDSLSYCWIIYRNGAHQISSEQRPEFIRYEYTFDLKGSYEIMLKASDGKDDGIVYRTLYLNISDYVAPDLRFLFQPEFPPSLYPFSILDFHDNATLPVSLENKGSAAVPSFNLTVEDYFIDIDSVVSQRTVTVDGISVEEVRWKEFIFVTDDSYVGNHTLRLTIDQDDSVEELNESNNYAEVFCRIVYEEEKFPSPVINSVHFDNTTPDVLTLINITVTVENKGAGDARWVIVRFYETEGVNIQEQRVDHIPPGEKRSVLFTFRPIEPGQHHFAVEIEMSGKIKDEYFKKIEAKEGSGKPVVIDPGDDDDDDDNEPNYVMILLGITVIFLAVALSAMIKIAEKTLRKQQK